MEFSSAIYAAVAFSFIFYFYRHWLSWSHNSKHGAYKAPPEAGGARLFTGHLHVMDGSSSTELPHFNLAKLADKHGPIFTIRLGARRAVVVSSWELAKEIFTTCDAAVSSRIILQTTKHLSCNFAMFGFAPYGPYWRRMRKLVSAELLSPRRLEQQRSVRVSENSLFIHALYKTWEDKRDGSGRVLVDMKRWFAELNMNVVLRVVAGKRLYDRDESDSEEMRRLREVIKEFFYLVGVSVASDIFPYLGWLDLGGYVKRTKRNSEDLDRIVEGWVASRFGKEYSGKDKPKDFIDIMLSVLEGENLEFDTRTITKAMCMVMLAGGSDPTTVILIWALSLLLNNRRVLEKAQQELDIHVGREKRVDESDIKNLVYLQAIIKETLRLYPASPLGGGRVFSKDCHVAGYRIPKGAWLFVNLWKLHRDPRVWPDDPLEFRPERFLNEHRDVDVRGQDFELIPFGAGRMICPGINFGLNILHLVLANLLHEEVDMSGSGGGFTNFKATPLDVLVVVAPRLSPSLYHACT